MVPGMTLFVVGWGIGKPASPAPVTVAGPTVLPVELFTPLDFRRREDQSAPSRRQQADEGERPLQPHVLPPSSLR
jgi:hypothetical protein